MNLKRYRGIAGAILSLAVLAGGCLPNPADAAALDGTRWNVIALNGEPVTTEAEGTLDFSDGKVTGTAFCNGFGGSYSRDGRPVDPDNQSKRGLC
ncbi:MAG: META domain-containing protein [Anaerolineae bacterium]